MRSRYVASRSRLNKANLFSVKYRLWILTSETLFRACSCWFDQQSRRFAGHTCQLALSLLWMLFHRFQATPWILQLDSLSPPHNDQCEQVTLQISLVALAYWPHKLGTHNITWNVQPPQVVPRLRLVPPQTRQELLQVTWQGSHEKHASWGFYARMVTPSCYPKCVVVRRTILYSENSTVVFLSRLGNFWGEADIYNSGQMCGLQHLQNTLVVTSEIIGWLMYTCCKTFD